MHIGTHHIQFQGTTHQKTEISALRKFPFKLLSPWAWILPLAVHLTVALKAGKKVNFWLWFPWHFFWNSATGGSHCLLCPHVFSSNCPCKLWWARTRMDLHCLPAKEVFMKQTLEELKLWLEDMAISGRNINLSYCPFSLMASSGSFPVSCHLLHSNHTRVCNIMSWTQSMNQSRLQITRKRSKSILKLEPEPIHWSRSPPGPKAAVSAQVLGNGQGTSKQGWTRTSYSHICHWENGTMQQYHPCLVLKSGAD